jgi:hypothetical protein
MIASAELLGDGSITDRLSIALKRAKPLLRVHPIFGRGCGWVCAGGGNLVWGSSARGVYLEWESSPKTAINVAVNGG